MCILLCVFNFLYLLNNYKVYILHLNIKIIIKIKLYSNTYYYLMNNSTETISLDDATVSHKFNKDFKCRLIGNY